MTYPVTLAVSIDSGLCAIRGQWTASGGEMVATYNTAQELALCIALADLWRGEGAAVVEMLDAEEQQGALLCQS